jgi:phage gpG-like protein
MSDFGVTVTPSFGTIKGKFEAFNQKSLDAIHFRLVEGGNRIRNKMIYLMQRTPKSGLKYRRGKAPNIKWHIASSPGNAPAVDSGELRRSITMFAGTDYVEVGVKSGAPYAPALEFGTDKAGKKKNVKILPRPFLTPATKAEIPRIQRRIVDDLTRFRI